MAPGRRGLSIEEVEDCNKFRRAQSQGAERDLQMKQVAICLSDVNAEHGSSASVLEMTKAIELIFPQAPNFTAVK
jgi:hypothetical protein